MKKKDRTIVVTVVIPKGLADEIRAIKVTVPAETIICRCEDISLEKIVSAIDEGFDTYDKLKRYLRVGMGACQGRTCGHLIAQILQNKTGKKVGEQAPGTFRPPIKPIKFSSIKKGIETTEQTEKV